MRRMALRSLQKHLEDNFHPAAAGTIDATFRLAIDGGKNEEVLTFHVNHGVLEFAASRSSLEARAQACDATFYFADTDTAGRCCPARVMHSRPSWTASSAPMAI